MTLGSYCGLSRILENMLEYFSHNSGAIIYIIRLKLSWTEFMFLLIVKKVDLNQK